MKKAIAIARLMLVGSVLMGCTGASGLGLADDRPNLLFFHSDTWPYCPEVMPIVNGIEREYRGRLNVVYVSMDEDEGQAIARENGVIGTPTILLLNEDGEQVNVVRGVIAQIQLEQLVEGLVAR